MSLLTVVPFTPRLGWDMNNIAAYEPPLSILLKERPGHTNDFAASAQIPDVRRILLRPGAVIVVAE